MSTVVRFFNNPAPSVVVNFSSPGDQNAQSYSYTNLTSGTLFCIVRARRNFAGDGLARSIILTTNTGGGGASYEHRFPMTGFDSSPLETYIDGSYSFLLYLNQGFTVSSTGTGLPGNALIVNFRGWNQ